MPGVRVGGRAEEHGEQQDSIRSGPECGAFGTEEQTGEAALPARLRS